MHESFDKTLKRYRISAKALAQEASISESHVSNFRNGKGGAMSHTTLENMLNAMERLVPGSKSYFYLLLAGKNPEQVDIDTFIESMDDSDLVQLFNAMAKRFSVKANLIEPI